MAGGSWSVQVKDGQPDKAWHTSPPLPIPGGVQLGHPDQLPYVTPPLRKDVVIFPVSCHGIPSLLTCAHKHTLAHIHPGEPEPPGSREAEEGEKEGQPEFHPLLGASRTELGAVVLATPTLPSPPDTVAPCSLAPRAEAGLWDHREAGGLGPSLKPGIEFHAGGAAAPHGQTHPVGTPRERPGQAQGNREPALLVGPRDPRSSHVSLARAAVTLSEQ